MLMGLELFFTDSFLKTERFHMSIYLYILIFIIFLALVITVGIHKKWIKTEQQTNKRIYKDPEFLKKFLNEQGKILPRRITGTSLKFQRRVAQAVKRARQIALLPYVTDLMK